jgi:hypothetical protein
MAKTEPESRATKKAGNAAAARPVPPPAPVKERFDAVAREEGDRLADRSPAAGDEGASRDRTPPPAPGPPQVTAAGGMTQESPVERKKMERVAAPMAEPQGAGTAASAPGMGIAQEPSPGSPCERAHALAERDRMRDAEAAQRACLAGDLDAPSREKGLVFLAELLDRQALFSEADAVIAEVDRRFPQSRPLDLYRRQRPMVQKRPEAVPVTR